MSGLRRPSANTRARSVPQLDTTLTFKGQSAGPNRPPPVFRPTPLTPPASPRQTRSFVDLSTKPEKLTVDCSQALGTRDEHLPLTPPESLRSSPEQVIRGGVQVCPFDVEILHDQRGRTEVFGTGAWSTVFKALAHRRPSKALGLASSPSYFCARPPTLVAVKRPARPDALTILGNEAKILTCLMSVPRHQLHVVTFFGNIPDDDSLVLDAVPLSLEDHIRHCSLEARERTSIWSLSEPVIGTVKVWLDLAHRLISTLSWLHNEAGIVHGDIKPGNILLQPHTGNSGFQFSPLFADFSSGQIAGAKEATPNTLSAVTREYTAPELLSSSVLRDPTSTATTASDVFSMAVTLLVAATGDIMVYPGSAFQRQVMATQGWNILNHVRNGEQGFRLPQHGIADRVLERAVLKAGMGRIDAARWLVSVGEQMRREPSKL